MPLQIILFSENESFGRYLAELLAKEGHETFCCQDSKETITLARNKQAGLIIIEITTASIAALELEQRLKSLSATRHIPVIVISDCPDLEGELLTIFDFIPKPLDLPRLRKDIAVLLRSAGKAGSPPQLAPMSDSDYHRFHEHFLACTGLHFDRGNRKTLERGVAKRMTALRMDSYAEYYTYLNRHGKNRHELQKLLQFLTVGETFFFRYKPHFSVMQKLLANQLLATQQDRIRCWSAGCSTGEEPYSLAIAIMEALPDWRQRNIKIIATDINNQSLKKAREGVYRSWAMRAIDKRYLDQYFDHVGESYLIKNNVKSLVEFSHLNLSTADVLAECKELGQLDAIFCRNVMIYFTPATTRRMVEKFATCLKPGGYLFLGHSESLSYMSTAFERQRQDNCFYYRKKTVLLKPAAPALPVVSRQQVIQPQEQIAVSPILATPSPDLLCERAQLLFEAENFSEAEELLNQLLLQEPVRPRALVLKGFILANNGRSQEALALIEKLLAIDDLLPEAYFLKGLLLDMIDCLTEAAEEYRKAILLDSRFIMPRYHLGRLNVRLGKIKEGARELKNSLRILGKGGDERIVPYSGGLSREVFMIQLQSELARIS